MASVTWRSRLGRKRPILAHGSSLTPGRKQPGWRGCRGRLVHLSEPAPTGPCPGSAGAFWAHARIVAAPRDRLEVGAALAVEAAPTTAIRPLCFSRNTSHETRDTAFIAVGGKGGATGNRRPDHCARRQVTVFQFTIVRHCSVKKLSCASVLPPPDGRSRRPVTASLRAFARHGAASRGEKHYPRSSVLALSAVLGRPCDERRSQGSSRRPPGCFRRSRL